MTDLKNFLRLNGIRLNTDLGQHFLQDEAVLDRIVEAGNIQPEDHIVEIGPGVGVLTAKLLEQAKTVTAIELDERMIPLLRNYTNYNEALTIVNENALLVPMPTEPYKVIANIPYHITSPLLRHVFMESEVSPKSLTLLIQKEVADRICDTENAGMLTVIVALFGKATKVTNVPPRAFIPPPKVDSAVIHIDCYDQPLVDEATMGQIMKLTKIAFSMKRKMLSNSFGTFPGGLELLSAASIDPKRRPQTLSVDEWVALAKAALQN